MTWEPVSAGERLNIPASLHNATIEAVEAYLRNKQQVGGSLIGRAPTQALVRISNNSGIDLGIGQIIGIDVPIWPGSALNPVPSTAGLDKFLAGDIILGGAEPVDPDHIGMFAVAVEPILDGAVGKACVQGLVRVKVKIDDLEVAEWADITDGEVDYLTASANGAARILWYEGAATGTLWCVCLLGSFGDGSGPKTAGQKVYSFVAHYAGYGSVGEPSNIAFYTVPGCRNSFLEIGLDVRECTEWYSPTGTHPAYVKPATSGGPLSQVAWGNPIASWDGDDDEYILLAYTARDSDGLPLGHGVNALPGYNIRARIQADGTLELSTLDATNNSHALVIAGFVRRVVHPRIEVGTQIEFGHLEACVGAHEDNGYEWDSVWGDGVWEPYVAP